MKTPFAPDIQLTAIAMAFRNAQMIADAVLPRTAPLDVRKFTYRYYPPEQFFTVPDTLVGRRSQVNRVEFAGTEKHEEVEDHALEEVLPRYDIDASPSQPLIPMTTEWLTNLLDLRREVRVASMIMDAANYAGNTEALAAPDRFNVPTVNPILYLRDVLDRSIMRPNTLVMGQAEWNALCTNPQVVKAAHGNSSDSGVANKAAVADLLEIQNIIVGQGWVNTAAKGQSASFARCWGGGVACLHIDPSAAKIAAAVPGAGTTFGFTAQFKTREAGTFEDKNVGARGGLVVRTLESVKEVISCPAAGFLITSVV